MLYHNRHYNNRQQLYDVRLGSNADGMGTEWTWNRGALRMFYDSNFAYGNGGTENNGNVYRMDHFVPTNDAATTYAMSLDYYQYDALNRIKGVWENKQSNTQGETSTGLTQQYLYDRFGNRRVDNPNSNFDVFNLPFNVDQATNRLLAPDNTISYDAAGNQTNDGYTIVGGGNRTYDANNKLVSAASSSGTVSYSYNANGSRVSKTVNGTTTWYIYGVGGELVAEYAANGTIAQKEYGYRNGQMLVVYDSTETVNKQMQWLVQDHLGSTRMVVDLSGSLSGMKRHDYLPFGEEIGANIGIRTATQGYPPPDDKVRQKFGSKERDTETGLDYFLARYFSSIQGRFISPDEFSGGPDELYDFVDIASENPTFYADIYNPQSLNKYQFAYNNPLRYTDADGHEAEESSPDVNCCPAIPAPLPAPIIPVVPVSPATGDQVIEEINRGINKLGDQYDKIPYVRQIRRDIGVTATPEINVPAPPLPLPGVPNVPGAPGRQVGPLPPPPPIEAKVNKVKPAPNAVGPHSTYKTDPQTGKVTGYTTWQPNPRHPGGFDPRKRVDTQPGGRPHTNKKTKQQVPTPHTQGKRIPGGVRPARKNELPQ